MCKLKLGKNLATWIKFLGKPKGNPRLSLEERVRTHGNGSITSALHIYVRHGRKLRSACKPHGVMGTNRKGDWEISSLKGHSTLNRRYLSVAFFREKCAGKNYGEEMRRLRKSRHQTTLFRPARLPANNFISIILSGLERLKDLWLIRRSARHWGYE